MLKPVPSRSRDIRSLNGLWTFALDHEVDDRPWTHDLPVRRQAPVPASYNDVFIDPSIRAHVGVVWYQRAVPIPSTWRGERIVVRVEAATHSGAVYIGDALVAEHHGGYTPFEVDITGHVTPGETTRVTIGVDNRLTNATIPPGMLSVDGEGRQSQRYRHDFFNYAGLARSVLLCTTPADYIADVTVRTDIRSADNATLATVAFNVTVAGASEDVRVVLRDQDGTAVASANGVTGVLEVPDPQLWQPGAAYLYQLEVQLGDAGDMYTLPVGVRTVEVKGQQLLINGAPFYFTGFGKHEDSAIRGKGHDDALLVHDFELMNWIGANSFRTSHYPYAEEWLDYADRHGIVVINETAAVGLNINMAGGIFGDRGQPTFSPETMNDATREAHAQAIRELIARDKNPPSVVMWCIANEPASGERGSREYFEPLVSLTRELDETRPVTFANQGDARFDTDLIVDLFDVVCLNRYYGWYQQTGNLAAAEVELETELRGWAATFDKPIIMTEYGVDIQDTEFVKMLDEGETNDRYSLFSQLTNLTRERDCLAHDDRIDGLAGLVKQWVEELGVDPALMAARTGEEALQEELLKLAGINLDEEDEVSSARSSRHQTGRRKSGWN